MSEKGLTTQEAGDLLKKYGLNELPEKAPPGNLKLAFNQIKSPALSGAFLLRCTTALPLFAVSITAFYS